MQLASNSSSRWKSQLTSSHMLCFFLLQKTKTVKKKPLFYLDLLAGCSNPRDHVSSPPKPIQIKPSHYIEKKIAAPTFFTHLVPGTRYDLAVSPLHHPASLGALPLSLALCSYRTRCPGTMQLVRSAFDPLSSPGTHIVSARATSGATETGAVQPE